MKYHFLLYICKILQNFLIAIHLVFFLFLQGYLFSKRRLFFYLSIFFYHYYFFHNRNNSQLKGQFYKGSIIKNYFQDGNNWDINIEYSEEDKPLGTGGALRKAGELFLLI